MALFKYVAVDQKREEFTETGTVLARDENDAERKLKAHNFSKVKLKRLSGVGALIGKLSADIK